MPPAGGGGGAPPPPTSAPASESLRTPAGSGAPGSPLPPLPASGGSSLGEAARASPRNLSAQLHAAHPAVRSRTLGGGSPRSGTSAPAARPSFVPTPPLGGGAGGGGGATFFMPGPLPRTCTLGETGHDEGNIHREGSFGAKLSQMEGQKANAAAVIQPPVPAPGPWEERSPRYEGEQESFRGSDSDAAASDSVNMPSPEPFAPKPADDFAEPGARVRFVEPSCRPSDSGDADSASGSNSPPSLALRPPPRGGEDEQNPPHVVAEAATASPRGLVRQLSGAAPGMSETFVPPMIRIPTLESQVAAEYEAPLDSVPEPPPHGEFGASKASFVTATDFSGASEGQFLVQHSGVVPNEEDNDSLGSAGRSPLAERAGSRSDVEPPAEDQMETIPRAEVGSFAPPPAFLLKADAAPFFPPTSQDPPAIVEEQSGSRPSSFASAAENAGGAPQPPPEAPPRFMPETAPQPAPASMPAPVPVQEAAPAFVPVSGADLASAFQPKAPLELAPAPLLESSPPAGAHEEFAPEPTQVPEPVLEEPDPEPQAEAAESPFSFMPGPTPDLPSSQLPEQIPPVQGFQTPPQLTRDIEFFNSASKDIIRALIAENGQLKNEAETGRERLAELESEMAELLICLGEETAKNAELEQCVENLKQGAPGHPRVCDDRSQAADDTEVAFDLHL